MDPREECQCTINRRTFLSNLSLGLGSVALGSILTPDLSTALRERGRFLQEYLEHLILLPKPNVLFIYFKVVVHLRWNYLIISQNY